MLYLMLDQTPTQKLAKVGFSNKTVVNRRKNYKTHNPLAIMRSSCAGGKSTEKKCHELLFSLGDRIVGTEWAVVPNELFNELYEKGMGYFLPKQKPIHFLEQF